jgi:hypothetical protein
LILGLMALAACTAPKTYSEADRIAIYATIVWRLYAQTDPVGPPNPPTMYIRRTADDFGPSPTELPEPEPLSEAVQNGIEQAMADLPTRIVWVDNAQQVPRDETTGAPADKGAIVTLGHIYFQKDGSAHVQGSIVFAPLVGGGRTYVVEQVDGTWQVTGSEGVMWES